MAVLRTYLRTERARATLQALIEHAAIDGRIHSLISPATHTGRRSSSQPNIQNLNMAPDDPFNFCGVLTAAPGAELVEIDYSNAENWSAALISGDDNLAAACASADFHSAMAARYFPDQWAKADDAERKHLRRMGKTVTFGTAYGMGKRKLADTLSISLDDAENILAAKDRAFPMVALAKRLAADKAARYGHITLWTGRKVTVPPDQAYVSWNYLNQGAVGELVKRSIVLISEAYRERGFRSRIAHDMHDAIIVEVWPDEKETALEIASQIMSSVMPAELNRRTKPTVQWIAEPSKPDENNRKWNANNGYTTARMMAVWQTAWDALNGPYAVAAPDGVNTEDTDLAGAIRAAQQWSGVRKRPDEFAGGKLSEYLESAKDLYADSTARIAICEVWSEIILWEKVE